MAETAGISKGTGAFDGFPEGIRAAGKHISIVLGDPFEHVRHILLRTQEKSLIFENAVAERDGNQFVLASRERFQDLFLFLWRDQAGTQGKGLGEFSIMRRNIFTDK